MIITTLVSHRNGFNEIRQTDVFSLNLKDDILRVKVPGFGKYGKAELKTWDEFLVYIKRRWPADFAEVVRNVQLYFGEWATYETI
jgi:hypothetical protein